jgi:hypothetical protein
MNRQIAFASLCVLVGCSDVGPMDVHPEVQFPAASAVQSYNSGGASFSGDSGCTFDSALHQFACSYTAQNLPAGPSNVVVFSRWVRPYRCVHGKSGKPSKKSPGFNNDWVDVSINPHVDALSVGGELSAGGITMVQPQNHPAEQLCTTSPYTAVQWVGDMEPYWWGIVVRWAEAPNDVYAELFELLDQ